VAVLNLTIKNSTQSTQTINACNSYTWNGSTYTNTGVYDFTTTNAVGCDSVAVLNLTIKNSTQSTQTVSSCDSYSWNGATYTTSGTRSFVTTNATGCDSIVVLNLTIKNSTQSTQTINACNSYTWNGTTYTNSGVYNFTTTNAVGCDSTAIMLLTINTCPIALHIKAFIEGFYVGSGHMQPTMYELGISSNVSDVDTVRVDLWDSLHLAQTYPDYSVQGILQEDGWVNVSIPGSYKNKRVYLALRNKNMVETWSAYPVLLDTVTVYDFSIDQARAYGDGVNPPMFALADGRYAFYSGDINQDGAIDAEDMTLAEFDASTFAFGYLLTDCNGDGTADLTDMTQIENNATKFIFYARPY
jgi:hypothetical protein